jgi:hypothetical protein
METEKFKLKDIGYGFLIPVIVAILIVIFPAVLRPALDSWFPPPDMATGAAGSSYAFITVIFTHGFALIVCFVIPVILGLILNKWAGGAAGFLLGTLYYVSYAGYYVAENARNFLTYVIADPTVANTKAMLPNLYADPSFIGAYIVGGLIIGYMAGALNNGSYNFKRMLGAGLTAGLTVGLFTYILNYTVAYGAWMTRGDPWFSLFTTMLPMILLGIIGPVVAKVMMWYGLQPTRH